MFRTAVPGDNRTPAGSTPPIDDLDDYSQDQIISLPHVLSRFSDIKGNQRLSLKILLLSGTTTNTIKAKVINNGTAVLVEAKFPKTFISIRHHIQNLRNMTDRRVQFSETDGRITAFHTAVSEMQPHGSSDDIWAKMTVKLPFSCEQQFHFGDGLPPIDLGWYEDIQILSLELVGIKSNFQHQFEQIKMRRSGLNQQEEAENNMNGTNATYQNPNFQFGSSGNAFGGGRCLCK